MNNQCLISCVGVMAGRWGPLYDAQNAVRWLALLKVGQRFFESTVSLCSCLQFEDLMTFSGIVSEQLCSDGNSHGINNTKKCRTLSLSKLIQPGSCQTEMGAWLQKAFMSSVQSVPWYTGVPWEGLFACLHVVCLMERLHGKACQWSVATYNAWTELLHQKVQLLPAKEDFI